MTKKGSPEISI